MGYGFPPQRAMSERLKALERAVCARGQGSARSAGRRKTDTARRRSDACDSHAAIGQMHEAPQIKSDRLLTTRGGQKVCSYRERNTEPAVRNKLRLRLITQ
jgi:hypothetical protein